MERRVKIRDGLSRSKEYKSWGLDAPYSVRPSARQKMGPPLEGSEGISD